jgi:poly [ADP-ribose] polymerase 2/3/4
MLDTLSDMEVANSIMKTTTGKARDADSVNLLDKRFQDLGMEEMAPLEPDSTEYRELSNYLIGSSGHTHGLRYQLQDIFRIERKGEHKRFETSKFAKLKDKDRRLLWHGSRTTNFGGILSQGLRIAPPEAPVNGYAFGKGVYLADVSSKSANYCRPGMSGNVGILLLCEVELSSPMYEIPTGNSNAQQEAEKHNCISTKGVGRTVPQAWKDAGCIHENLKGVTIVSFSREARSGAGLCKLTSLQPDGKPGPNKLHTTGYLEYNEYSESSSTWCCEQELIDVSKSFTTLSSSA